VVTRLLAGEVVTHHGRHVHVDDAFLLTPRPAQDAIPLLIGGSGTQVLRLGARFADIVSMSGTGKTLADGHSHEVDWSAAAIDERVAIVHRESPPNGPALDALVQYLGITDDRDTTAARVADRIAGATAADVIGAPYVLVGTLDELAAELARHHERWGFTSYVVRAGVIDAAAALIDRLPRA